MHLHDYREGLYLSKQDNIMFAAVDLMLGETINQCYFNAGAAFTMLAQH